jgi:hypothetical protein
LHRIAGFGIDHFDTYYFKGEFRPFGLHVRGSSTQELNLAAVESAGDLVLPG